LAVALHVHVLHRSRRQVPARRACRIGLRAARTHDEIHADRGSAPHVRRRIGRRARRPAHERGDEGARQRRSGESARGRCDRPADGPTLSELPLQRHDRLVRRRPVVERGDVLHGRAQGPIRRDETRRRPPAARPQLSGARSGRRSSRRSRRADAQRAERGAARRFHSRLRRGRRPVESRRREGGLTLSPDRSAQGVPPQDRHARAASRVARRTRRLGKRMGCERGRLAAERRRSRVRRIADGPRRRAREVRELDRAACSRHQSTAGEFRLRPVRIIAIFELPATQARRE